MERAKVREREGKRNKCAQKNMYKKMCTNFPHFFDPKIIFPLGVQNNVHKKMCNYKNMLQKF